ncbi:DciA family protein [uncultured Corynebacterium sp.]|uniref:DciA family protein n=1 Tax=uncultured Corynebacterium sp. TaxID=159447 RepID=UPI0025994F5B|nr:DciA family protein [uncultured Corynebacterium sp.]
MSDLIKATFDNLRATARRRGGKLPDLSRQGTSVVPRRSVGRASLGAGEGASISVPGINLDAEETRPWIGRGRPTGPDGRALGKSMQVKGFGALVSKEIKRRDWTHNIAYGWVMGNWPGLVGEKIAQHTRVEMIKEGEVFVSCDQTAWATQLKYMQSTVLSEIARKVGPGVVTKLHVYPPKTKSWRYGPLHVKGRGPRDTYG